MANNGNNNQSQIESGLVFLDIKENTSPFDLVSKWLEEAKEHGIILPVINVATSSKSGYVTNRTVILQEFKNNTFIFMTDDRSKKAIQIDENPKIAACLLLQYFEDKKYITRQIRIEGTVNKLPYEENEKYWKMAPPFSQIRSLVAKEPGKIDWDEKVRRHEELLKEAKSGIKFKMPEHQVGFEIIPNMFNFHHGVDNLIADHVEFNKGSNNKWTFERIA